jgi:hypothetical protein
MGRWRRGWAAGLGRPPLRHTKEMRALERARPAAARESNDGAFPPEWFTHIHWLHLEPSITFLGMAACFPCLSHLAAQNVNRRQKRGRP